jgi:hypothetical protein
LYFFVFTVHAKDICTFHVTTDYFSSLRKEGSKPSRISKNHLRWSFSEKAMIHLMISLDQKFKGISRDEALIEFSRIENYSSLKLKGEIQYFEFNHKHFAFVHYWPDQREFGAYFNLKIDGAFKLIAQIKDSQIDCLKESFTEK